MHINIRIARFKVKTEAFCVIFPDNLVKYLTTCEAMVVLTGAGISAESGIPVFRGPDGIWAKYRPEELATPEAFSSNPKLVWEWYAYRRAIIRRAKPNAGHYALSRLEGLVRTFTLVTQNVDGLHHMAGSRNVLEVHGNILVNRCSICGCESMMEDISPSDEVPRCGCGGLLRPGVVWFGESLPEGVFEAAVDAVRTCEILLVAGTSSVVYPVASLPNLALSRKSMVIEINTSETPLTPKADFHLRGKASVWLPLIAEAVEGSLRDVLDNGRSHA